MNYILLDGPRRNHLLPFTFTRPVAEIRVGIMTSRERWEARTGPAAARSRSPVFG